VSWHRRPPSALVSPRLSRLPPHAHPQSGDKTPEATHLASLGRDWHQLCSYTRTMAPKARSLPSAITLMAIAAVCGACNGCSISPKPEPPIDAAPVLDPGILKVTPARDYGDPSGIEGGPGSVDPASGLVRVWNLDSQSPPLDAIVEDDGSFAAHFDVNIGDEVRVQIVAGDVRSEPVDLRVTSESGPAQLAVHALGDCLLLEPSLEVIYPVADSLLVRNTCAFDVEIATPSLRRPVAGLDAGQGSSWPAMLVPGASATVEISVQPQAGSFEEILFVRATLPQADRRPLTVRGKAP